MFDCKGHINDYELLFKVLRPNFLLITNFAKSFNDKKYHKDTYFSQNKL